jgi:hypothetical protein
MSQAETNAELEAENARLQSRIQELEAEAKSSSHSESHTEAEKLRTDSMDDARNELSRLVHALSMAFVEELRSAADILKVVSDEAYRRREARAEETMSEIRLKDLEEDVAGVLNKGIEKTIASPRRVVDKFYEVYHGKPKN